MRIATSSPTEVVEVEEVDAGVVGTTTSDARTPLLLSKVTKPHSEGSAPYFTSETRNILWPAGPVRDLTPATTCSPQRQQHFVAGSDHATSPARVLCNTLPPGGLIKSVNIHKCSHPSGERGGTQLRGACNLIPTRPNPKTYNKTKGKYCSNKLTDKPPGNNI